MLPRITYYGDLDAGGEQQVEEIKIVASQVLQFVYVDLVVEPLQPPDDSSTCGLVGMDRELCHAVPVEVGVAVEVVLERLWLEV